MTREELESRVERVRRELEEASAGRYPIPKLIAVTKTHSAEEILPLAEMGITDIGENRVQELLTKLPELRDRFQIHLIGRLQRNKVKQIVGDVCMIQSVDSEPLAREIHNRALAAGRRMPVLVEISPAGEEQKGGVLFEETEAFLKQIAPLEGIEIRGLMAVMPLTEDQDYLDGLFARTRGLFDRIRDKNLSGIAMEELSMGMSGDYRLAAAHGATMVRVGSAIFGPRG
ncbi:YggS family pyridoxal phosphate-dependent enzyme [Clostridiales bacterium FE2011]|nr:YggS family pyridoxal phosphate-dependent enzyme [Clostridiales bacterium FE2011]QTE73608.1 YggS family pyridoxal phosphate-dependent enzyme [Clostridiales bacterium FE2010]